MLTRDLLLLDVLILHAAERIRDAENDCADGGRWEPLARLVGGFVAGPNYALMGRRITLGKPELP